MPKIVHFELNVKDVEKTKKFYESVFGWKIKKWEGPVDYWLIMTGEEGEPGIDGGLGHEEEGIPSVVNTIDVNDVDEIIKKIKNNGGEVVRPACLSGYHLGHHPQQTHAARRPTSSPPPQ